MLSLLNRISWKILNSRATRSIDFATTKLYSPPLNRPNFSQSEPWMLTALSLVINHFKGGLFDVGVNLGQTMATYKLLEPDGEYIGLEPNSACVAFACSFAECNRFNKVTIVPAALSESSGLIMLDYYQDSVDDSSASIVPNFRSDRRIVRSEPITSITYEDLIAKVDLSNIAIVKIDVEGAEAAILSELSGFLRTQRPAVLLEVLPAYNASNKPRLASNERILKTVKPLSYRIFRMNHDKKSLHSLQEVDEFGIYSEIDMSDYLLIPEEKLVDIEEAARSLALTMSVFTR